MVSTIILEKQQFTGRWTLRRIAVAIVAVGVVSLVVGGGASATKSDRHRLWGSFAEAAPALLAVDVRPLGYSYAPETDEPCVYDFDKDGAVRRSYTVPNRTNLGFERQVMSKLQASFPDSRPRVADAQDHIYSASGKWQSRPIELNVSKSEGPEFTTYEVVASFDPGVCGFSY